MNILSRFLGIVVVTSTMSAYADLIDVPSPGRYNNAPSQNLSANIPEYGNIWTGVAQSFTADDPNILFGFKMFATDQETSSVLLSLYSGDGDFSNLLARRTVIMPAGEPYREMLIQADFSSVSLTPGAKYTVVASQSPEALPPLSSYGTVSIEYASTLNQPNPYSGGRFYFSGSSYDMSNPAFADRDIAFRVIPVAKPDVIIQSIGLPDINSNRSSEIATLELNNGIRVLIVDGNTKKIIRAIKITSESYAPIGLSEVPDVNGNGSPEIAVLYRNEATQNIMVTIMDAANQALIKNMNFGKVWAKSISSLQDTDSNGSPEISVMSLIPLSGRNKVDIKDALTGSTVRSIYLP